MRDVIDGLRASARNARMAANLADQRAHEERKAAQASRDYAEQCEDAASYLENREAKRTEPAFMRPPAVAQAELREPEPKEQAPIGEAWMHSRTYARLLKDGDKDLVSWVGSVGKQPTYKGDPVYVSDRMPDNGLVYGMPLNGAEMRVRPETAIEVTPQVMRAEEAKAEERIASNARAVADEAVKANDRAARAMAAKQEREQRDSDHDRRHEDYAEPYPLPDPEPVSEPLEKEQAPERPKARKGDRLNRQYTED